MFVLCLNRFELCMEREWMFLGSSWLGWCSSLGCFAFRALRQRRLTIGYDVRKVELELREEILILCVLCG